MTLAPDLVAAFAACVAPGQALSAPEDQAPYLSEWRDRWTGRAALVLRPGSTDEVAAIVRLAAAHRVGLIPQGGNTGLVGGQIPDGSGGQIVVSLRRLNRVRHRDAAGLALTVEAGVTLLEAQAAAGELGLLFPLSLAAEGTATIGGNISTNAGGTAVLAYGNTRDLVLGLEAVLPSGEVWNGLKSLRKDNTGYDLKNLFIGAEGTLGIVTAATLKLFPAPRSRITIFAATPSPRHALEALGVIRDAAPGLVTSFELMPRFGLDIVLRHIPGTRHPLSSPSPWALLIEIAAQTRQGFREAAEAALAEAVAKGALSDAAIAESEAQAAAFWRLREAMSEAQKFEGGSIKHDVAVPVAAVPAFLEEALAEAECLVPGCRPVPFGHLGDGNIHFNITQPDGADTGVFLGRRADMNAAVFAVVARHRGSISAEHGIGIDKRALLPTVKSPVELGLMRAIKTALDPAGIMNPGKLL
ncbi:MAG: FAD-binding oxidoreductase [Alphaproteobacteria bacterium]|nr:FAD-binding oxidoreductase [Alphaproteobacteria bacterium]